MLKPLVAMLIRSAIEDMAACAQQDPLIIKIYLKQ